MTEPDGRPESRPPSGQEEQTRPTGHAPPGGQTSSSRVRLTGLDAARGLALVGMMTVHVLPGPLSDGTDPVMTAAYQLAEGRSAALFAVLAGVSLVIARGTAAQIAVRAGLVAAIGLSLGSFRGPIAVILTCYGVLFLLALPFLRLRAGTLAGLALAWMLLSPLASQWLRGTGLTAPAVNPSWKGLEDPLSFAQNLLLTGYYPALTWLAYLLAGMAAGRTLTSAQSRDAVQANHPGQGRQVAQAGRWFAVAGAGLALAGWLGGLVVVRRAGGVQGLNGLLEPGSLLAGRGEHLLDETFYGTTPLTSWWWAGVPGPHSGSVTDLMGTGGSAMLVLGAVLMLHRRLGPWIRPLAAAGAMTLTLYTAHVLVMSSIPRTEGRGWPLLLTQVAIALYVATVSGAPKVRGPLEELVAGSVAVLTRRGR